MKFPRFDMERMQSQWEHKVTYDLSESGVEALTLQEITRDPKELMKTKLGYAEGVGREATRALIAGIHPGHDADDVMITTGPYANPTGSNQGGGTVAQPFIDYDVPSGMYCYRAGAHNQTASATAFGYSSPMTMP